MRRSGDNRKGKSRRQYRHKEVCRSKGKLDRKNAESLAAMRGIWCYVCPVCGAYHLTSRKQA